MININLIPVEARKKSKTAQGPSLKISQEFVVGVGGSVVVVLIILHVLLAVIWSMRAAHLSEFKRQWEGLLPDQKRIEDLNTESKDLKKKIDVLSGITSKKTIVWARKFNTISDVLPKGLWLRRIALEKGGLVMEGTVVSKTQAEIANVGTFVTALKKDDAFMADFASLEVNSIQRGKRNTVEVADFIITAKLK